MLPVCDFQFGGDCDNYILYIGLFQCNGGQLALRLEVVPELVVNKWEEIFYFKLQRVT